MGFAVFLLVFAPVVLRTQPVWAQEATQEAPAEPAVESAVEAVADEKAAAEEPKSADKPKQSDAAKEKPADDSKADAEPKKKAKPEPKSDEKKDEKKSDAKPEMKKAEEDKPAAPAEESSKSEAKADKAENSTEAKKDAEAEKKPEVAKPEPKKPEPKKPEAPVEPARLPNIGSSETPMIPGQPWRVHDIRRPRPSVVTPGELSTYDKPGTAPSDAVILFDGTDLSNWAHVGPDGEDDLREAQWKVENGYMEVTPRTGTMRTIESFGSCQLHIEWQAPEKVRGDSQGRGNSGIKIMQVYEVQVLDSYNNRSYADGYAGAMYGQYPPMVNATRKPGEWQVYDIIFEAPKFKDDGTIDEPAYLTLIHNGVLLHHRRAFYGPTGGRVIQKYNLDSPVAPLTLQDHGNPVRFRNIWLRPLSL